MKVLIIGASGSGTTTLGKEIEKRTHFVHLDTDNYYWKPTKVPFQEKLPLVIRNENLKSDIRKFKNVIISGSMISWGKEWETTFDLVIFIHLQNEKRIERLKEREIQRYGEKLLTDKNILQKSKAFLEWANQYENPNFDGRTHKTHLNWLKKLKCTVLKIDGEKKMHTKIEIVLSRINTR
ncbi:AAA family ATPase [Aquimarina sp. AU474]|uniref:AAA family ATPase n=1 Tax=Aquimarina sp. AU474 TaxID=2108529 RepID=UPI000D68A3A5|nr:AAA family ATPase [Aquimarina sp. AU474]